MAVSAAEDSRKLSEAEKLSKSEPSSAETIYKSILSKSPGTTEAAVKNLETALVGLGELYRDQKRVKELAQLILQTRSALSAFAKAKTAKLGSSYLFRKYS
jgi:26S proteasome regulatory subunit N6